MCTAKNISILIELRRFICAGTVLAKSVIAVWTDYRLSSNSIIFFGLSTDK